LKATLHPLPGTPRSWVWGRYDPSTAWAQLLEQDQGRERGESSTPLCLTAPLSPSLGSGGWTPSWEAAGVFTEGQFLPIVTRSR